jgi:hypothetical protein
MEVLSDLENANILGCILAHHKDFDNNPKAYATFFTKVAPFKGVTILPPIIFFSVTCPVTSFPLPHLVLTDTAYSTPYKTLLQSLGQSC